MVTLFNACALVVGCVMLMGVFGYALGIVIECFDRVIKDTFATRIKR